MKNMNRLSRVRSCFVGIALVLSLCLAVGVLAESTTKVAAPQYDPSPAVFVAKKTAQSVVGVSCYTQTWDRTQGQKDTLYSQGSGVAIAEGGYVLTNYHVVESCNSFTLLLSDGTKVPATIVGTDKSTDLAVLKAEERGNELVPVDIATTANLPVGSTVIAIGNPGGEVLANTVTQGIISALERNVRSSNTSRAIKYVQHDAAINSGNSGGGLFNIQGELVGINTLKYSGSAYSTASYEGLGFAIPVDTAYPIAMDLIQYGEVQRPQMGITCTSILGPDEAMPEYAPSGVVVATINDESPALDAGMKLFDCITQIDGIRVKDVTELTTELDQHKDGDTVTVTIVRYSNPYAVKNMAEIIYSLTGGMGDNAQGGQRSRSMFGYGYSSGMGNSFETIEIPVTLKLISSSK